MPFWRGALSTLPILGPAINIADSVALGDHPGVVLELLNLALDLGTTVGQIGSVRAAWRAAGAARMAARAGRPSHKVLLPTAVRLAKAAAHRVHKVAKSSVKRKVISSVRQATLKVSLAATAAAAEKVSMLRKRRRKPALVQDPALQPFEAQSDPDAQLHAVLAREMYQLPTHRRGVALPLEESHSQPACWYTYVGGDEYRGFWYSPGPRHLVLAERGTRLEDSEDLGRDVLLAVGTTLAAVSSRAKASAHALHEQLHCHDCDRVTLTGHSLGGTMAVFLACTALGAACRVSAVHAFNAGGLPDLNRLIAAATAQVDVVCHHIEGDLISVGFLPLFQRTYPKRFEGTDAHHMVHFLPSWVQ